MPSDEMRERARKQFEEWMRKEMSDFSLRRMAPSANLGDYAALDTEDCWRSFQAGAREEMRSAAREMREAKSDSGFEVLLRRKLADWLERREK